MIDLKLPTAKIIPAENSKALYGIEPTILTRADMTSDYAWWRLAAKNDACLGQRDFRSHNIYIKYFLLTLGLLEYSVLLIGGTPGGGKSLFLSWLTLQMTKLFGKRATMDWVPPHPKMFGKYFYLYDEDFQGKVEKGFNELARYEKDTGELASPAMLEKFLIYNTFFSLEECDSYGDRQSQTNLTKLIARVNNRRRHTDTCTAMVMIDTDRFAPILKKQATHVVDCIWQGHFADWCSIQIQDNRPGGTGLVKWLWLNPADWAGAKTCPVDCKNHIWRSKNISALTHEVNITYGNKPKKKIEIEGGNHNGHI